MQIITLDVWVQSQEMFLLTRYKVIFIIRSPLKPKMNQIQYRQEKHIS